MNHLKGLIREVPDFPKPGIPVHNSAVHDTAGFPHHGR